MSPEEHSCAWCSSGPSKPSIINAFRMNPNEAPAAVAQRCGTTLAFVYQVRSQATRRGCLSTRVCKVCQRKPMPSGGVCRQCFRKERAAFHVALRARESIWRYFMVKLCQGCGERIPFTAARYLVRSLCDACPSREDGVGPTKPRFYFLPGPFTQPVGGSVLPRAVSPLARVTPSGQGFQSGCAPS